MPYKSLTFTVLDIDLIHDGIARRFIRK